MLNENVRLQGRCDNRAQYNRHQLHFGVDGSAAVTATRDLVADREESILETGDFRPFVFVTGAEAAKEAKPARRQVLPTARVFRLDRRGKRWVEALRFQGRYQD